MQGLCMIVRPVPLALFSAFFLPWGVTPPKREKNEKNKANANANAWFLYQCLFPGSYTRGRQTRTLHKNPATLAGSYVR